MRFPYDLQQVSIDKKVATLLKIFCEKFGGRREGVKRAQNMEQNGYICGRNKRGPESAAHYINMIRKITATIALTMAAILTATAGPQIKWLELRHNFGAFDEDGGLVACKFRFVNTGDEPLTILSARASCGCAQPAYPRESVAPGDTGAVDVAFNPIGRPGRFSKKIYVESNAPTKRTSLLIEGVVIGAKSTVESRYPIDMGKLKLQQGAVMFGQVAKPHVKTVFVEGYNRSADSITPRVTGRPKHIDINVTPKTVGPGEQMSLICYLHSGDTDLWGIVEDTVGIEIEGKRYDLPTVAIVNEDFSKLKPEDIEKAPTARLGEDSADFGIVNRTGGQIERTVELYNDGRSTLEIRRVYTADAGVRAEVDRKSVKKGKSARITIIVDPAKLKGELLNARISVITNDPMKPTQTLRAVGEVR